MMKIILLVLAALACTQGELPQPVFSTHRTSNVASSELQRRSPSCTPWLLLRKNRRALTDRPQLSTISHNRCDGAAAVRPSIGRRLHCGEQLPG
jgi:hypothetical protein